MDSTRQGYAYGIPSATAFRAFRNQAPYQCDNCKLRFWGRKGYETHRARLPKLCRKPRFGAVI